MESSKQERSRRSKCILAEALCREGLEYVCRRRRALGIARKRAAHHLVKSISLMLVITYLS